MHATLTAVLVERPSAWLGQPDQVRVRLEHQLEALADVRAVGENGDEGWRALADILANAAGPVGVVDAGYVGHASPLADTLADSRLGSALLRDHGTPLGVLRVAPADLAAAEEIVRDLATEGAPLRVTTLATRLAAAGADVQVVDVGPYVAGIAVDAAEARRLSELARHTDEHRLRLIASARPGDGFYSTFAVRRIARPVTAGALRLRLRPDTITVMSLIIGLTAAVVFAAGERWAMVLGAVLLQLSLVLDCVDGEVARYTLRFSAFGSWLDGVADRVKEFAVYAGLALGAARIGEDVWVLAAAALGLLVVRHHVDFGFAVRQSARASARAAHDDPALAAWPGLARAGRAAARLSDRTNRQAAQMWAKRVVILPIGERWLVISVLAALWSPRAVFVALLVTGTIAALYTTVGRVLRSAAERYRLPVPGRRDLAVLTDAPGLVHAVAPPHWLGAPYGWLAPAGSRLVEFGAVSGVAAALGEPRAAYTVLAVVALRLYDLVYRLRHLGTRPARWAAPGALGAAGRTSILAVSALAGAEAFVIASVAVAAMVLVVSAADWWQAWPGGDTPVAVRQLRKVS